MSSYNQFEHRHRFAAWAAARAAQRGWLATAPLVTAIEQSGVMAYVKNYAGGDVTADQFDALHADWVFKLLSSLSLPADRLYGRAAKLLAIYVKTMVVVGPYADSQLANEAHPPVDSRLLATIARRPGLDAEVRKRLRAARWTKLTRNEYLAIIGDLRSLIGPEPRFWMIEANWSPRDI